MPKIMHPKDPAWTPDVEAAMRFIGNRGRNEIVRYLNVHGPARRGEIVEAVTSGEASVAQHLIALENCGIIIVDTVRGQRHGRAPRYSVNFDRVKELIEALKNYLLNRYSINSRERTEGGLTSSR